MDMVVIIMLAIVAGIGMMSLGIGLIIAVKSYREL